MVGGLSLCENIREGVITVYPNAFDPYSQYTQRTEVPRVSGRPGAEAYRMAPNSSVILLDETASLIWFKQTDSGGYPTLVPYTITPYKQASPVDELEMRVARLEAALNGKSNSTNDESSE